MLESFADLDTPLSLYLKLAQQRYTFLLESVVGGERFGRYSFIGLPAKVRIRVKDGQVEVEDRGGVVERHDGDPLAVPAPVPRRASARRPSPDCRASAAGSPAISATTRSATSSASSPRERTRRPMRARRSPRHAAAADRRACRHRQPRGKIYLIVYADPGEPNAYWNAQDRLQQLRRKLRTPAAIPFQTATSVTRAESEMGADAFQAAVRRAREYIAAGDVMQVVLSQRMRLPFAASPLSLYRALRSLNPSPYMFYYDFGDFHIVGASPEILVRKEGSTRHAAADRGHAPARRDPRRRPAARAGARRAIPRRSPST